MFAHISHSLSSYDIAKKVLAISALALLSLSSAFATTNNHNINLTTISNAYQSNLMMQIDHKHQPIQSKGMHTDKESTMKKPQIVLVHGLYQRHWIMKLLARRLEKMGYVTHTFGYKSLNNNVTQNAKSLDTYISKKIGDQEFTIVAHSLGGLVAREFVNNHQQWIDDGQLQSVVTLGTPHVGCTVADYMKRFAPFMVNRSYPKALDGTMAELSAKVNFGVIAGNKPYGIGKPLIAHNNKHTKTNLDNDGLIYVHETQLKNATDHLILPVTHSSMLMKKSVAKQTVYFIENGTFKR